MAETLVVCGMYLRRDNQTLKDGTRRCYVSLAHNVREPGPDGKTRSKPILFAKLGAEDDLDKKTLVGMRDALSRLIAEKWGEEPPDAGQVADTAAVVRSSSAGLKLLCSRQYGMRLIAERVWDDLGLANALRSIEEEELSRYAFERVVFAMVLNRLVDPGSKRACNEWVCDDAYFPEAADFGVQHFYRALDVLEKHSEAVLAAIGQAARASCSAEELSLLLMDTTSTYYESDLSDAERKAIAEEWQAHFDEGAPKPSMPYPQVVNDPPMRMRGHSKDARPSQPQVKVGLVSTADGRIVHVETLAGNTSDQSPTVDMLVAARERLGPVGRLVAVMDSGMGGSPNLAGIDALEPRIDRVSAVPLRNSKFADEQLLSKAGRWAKHPFKPGYTVRSLHLTAEESPSGRAELWVATRNEAEAGRQRRVVDKEVKRVRQALADDPHIDGHGRPVCALLSNPKRRRFVKPNAQGTRLILDQERIRVEKRRAGVHVVRSTLTDLDVEATLRAYQAQYGIEDQFRAYKGPLKLRPMHHRATRRIHAHVLVCSLALMLLRELERRTQRAFDDIRKVFRRVQATQLQQGRTVFWQRQEWTHEAVTMLDAIGAEPGPRTWGAAREDSP